MDLVPCGVCRRHVDSRATSCPFCATPVTRAVQRLVDIGGRLSRAAVFAGVAACYTSSPPQQTTPPPPPPDDTHQTQEQEFAKPPDDTTTTTTTPATTNGSIEGTVYSGRMPASGTWVTLRDENGSEQRVQTDANGHYRFADLPAGNYSIETPWNGNPHAAPPRRSIQVFVGKTARADLSIYTEPVDRGPCCKPYGAPPARRRVV